MVIGRLAGLVVALAVGMSCRSTPTAPSSPGADTAAAEATANAAMAQALAQTALAFTIGTPLGNPVTVACPTGGSMVMTFVSSGFGSPSSIISTSSRVEYRDCANGRSTISSDPYLEMTGTYEVPRGPGTYTSTQRTTGTMRITADGVPSRVAYDCTTHLTITFPADGSLPAVTPQTSGTMTIERPIGNLVTRPCAPATP